MPPPMPPAVRRVIVLFLGDVGDQAGGGQQQGATLAAFCKAVRTTLAGR